MSLSPQQLLQNLALGQALLVAPALGESYAGRTAQTIASLMLMLAADLAVAAERRARACQALVALLESAEVGDPALAADSHIVVRGLEDLPPAARMDRLLGLVTHVHAWADSHDAELARRCRRVLADMAAAERLSPPALDPAA